MAAAAGNGAQARLMPERRRADAAGALAGDAVQTAGSHHPDVVPGMADAASVLWRRFLKFDTADPGWPDRDRLVLSAGNGATPLRAFLHPTGPPGQDFANAVGMALAERLLAARFGRSLVDHRIWVIAAQTDLTEGIAYEAAAFAGQRRLARLTVLYDDHGMASDGAKRTASTDDPLRRFAGLGWAIKRIDGHDPAEVAGALSFALRSPRPTVIACRTGIGFAAPNRARPAALHAAPRAGEEASAAARALGRNAPRCTVPDEIAAFWMSAGTRGAGARRAWLRRLAHHSLRAEFERVMEGRLPERLPQALASLKAEFAADRPRLAPHEASRKVLERVVPLMAELIGGSTDRAVSDLNMSTRSPVAGAADRAIGYGAHEPAMAGTMNGLACHGGILPYGATVLARSDCMHAPLHLAALARARGIYVFTRDPIGFGAGGPTLWPLENLASLRAIPNLFVFHPADALETAECWEIALARRDGPSALVLAHEAVPALRAEARENLSARGGYVLAAAPAVQHATLIASGAEVAVAIAAQEELAAEGIGATVVSLPCWELFGRQGDEYRKAVLGPSLRVGIEAATGFGWERWLGPDGIFVGSWDLDTVAAAVRQRIG